MFETSKDRVQALKIGLIDKEIEALYIATNGLIVRKMKITRAEYRGW
jgi:hypothetical protein